MMVEHKKKALRAELRQRLLTIDPLVLSEKSAQAAKRLIETDEFRHAGTIMIFLPLRYEIDARPIALKAWQQGKTVTVPLVNFEHKHMFPIEIRSLDEPTNTDRYGLRTPQQEIPCPIESIDLVITPGLGFDRDGWRIGRGGGFYDRLFCDEKFNGTTCGLAMDEQITNHIPTHSHDVPVDMLVTDKHVLRFRHH